MKKDFLSKIKGEILSVKDAKIIQGGYNIEACNAPQCPQGYLQQATTVWCGSSYLSLYWNNFQYCRK